MSEHHAPLPEATAFPYSHSRPLPPYRGILAVDAKDFTGYPAIEHGILSRAIPELLQTSFARAGLSGLWKDRRFPNSTGDGYVFGFDPAAMPFVIHPWLRTLQDVLTEFNVHSMGVARIRLRVSLHIGPLPDNGEEFDGNGTPRNDTHRLLDSRPVKAILASSNENITQVAAILSDRCYQDAVASGYTGRHPDYFIEVPATVEGKRFDQQAWLHVPVPSGSLYDRRVLGDQVIADQETGDDSARVGRAKPRKHSPRSVTNYRADHGNLNRGTVHGGQQVSNTTVSGDYLHGSKVGKARGNLGDTVQGGKNTEQR
ncbi:hypothetical protein [Streptomyces abikoensis]|uniref:hypothetical protein n=1 Tax=Streptomyces abikoensis TaxID=97398 RepID=UPI001678B0CB|nr:hypothetical protein [Streptomyces abikoensis]